MDVSSSLQTNKKSSDPHFTWGNVLTFQDGRLICTTGPHHMEGVHTHPPQMCSSLKLCAPPRLLKAYQDFLYSCLSMWGALCLGMWARREGKDFAARFFFSFFFLWASIQLPPFLKRGPGKLAFGHWEADCILGANFKQMLYITSKWKQLNLRQNLNLPSTPPKKRHPNRTLRLPASWCEVFRADQQLERQIFLCVILFRSSNHLTDVKL